MTTIDIYSGFLGAGKTTLIKKMIREAYQGEKIVLIENEFGEIGIDGGFMQDAGIQVNEMNSGCICCSLVGDFGRALKQVISDYHPDRILIEPSGVGKLSDVIGAVERVADESVTLGSFITVADATKCKVYLKNFGEFYTNQIETASAIILSRTGSISEEKLAAAVALLREHNQNAVIITTPWDQLSGAQILEAMQKQHTLTEELADMIRSAQSEEDDEDEEEEHHHHHHHDDDDEDDEHEHHCCHHHDHDDEHEHHCCHHHDHDDHDEDEDEHHCCHHHHHHGHDADEVFQSWGVETPKKFTEEEIRNALAALDNGETYGIVLRAKGIVPTVDGTWLHFDHVPGEIDVRTGTAAVTGRLCVIGSKLDEKALAALFGV
ncbi:MAG: CobW family GTP-binding protein [Oscillospiraceae bacterium]